MNLFIIILIVHFLADFALQTHEQSQGKSEGSQPWNKWLFYHVATYSMIWFIVCLGLGLTLLKAFTFFAITGLLHYQTDWITARIGKPFWEKQDFHNGFVVVGFDQVLHYLQLYYTFKAVGYETLFH